MYDSAPDDKVSVIVELGKGRCAMTDSRVDEYAACLECWRDEFAALRTILLDTELTEACKWHKPCYTHAGKNIVIFQPFNDLCALMFFKDALLNNHQALLRDKAKTVAHRSGSSFARLPT
jgi:uncharacterized protein YdeI (YjbR/CyaY-like superfamily)